MSTSPLEKPSCLFGIPEQEWNNLADQAEEDMFNLSSTKPTEFPACHLLGISPHYLSWKGFVKKTPHCVVECIYLEEPVSLLNPLNSTPKTFEHESGKIFYKSFFGWTRSLLLEGVTPEHIVTAFFPPIYRARELSIVVSLVAEYIGKPSMSSSLELNCGLKPDASSLQKETLKKQIGSEVAKIYRNLL